MTLRAWPQVDPQHPGRPARRGRHAHRPGLPHRPLGDRTAGARGGRDPARPGRDALRRLSSAIPATDAHREPPACSTACPTATTPLIVLRRLIRSLPTRQGVLGVATCDKGLPAMMVALAGCSDLPAILVPGGVTLPGDRRRGRRQGADHRRALRPRRDHPRRRRRAGLPRLRLAGRRLPVPGHRRHRPGGRRGAGPDAAAHRALPLRPADLARHGAPLGLAPCSNLSQARIHLDGHPHRQGHRKRHARPRSLRRIDQPVAAHSGHRPRRRPAPPHRRRLEPHQSTDPAPGRRAAQRAASTTRPSRSSWPAACRR